MGKPVTLLERLCAHAWSFGAPSIVVEYKDSRQWIFANIDGKSIKIADYAISSSDAKELLKDL